jgi:hypothetical protein
MDIRQVGKELSVAFLAGLGEGHVAITLPFLSSHHRTSYRHSLRQCDYPLVLEGCSSDDV